MSASRHERAGKVAFFLCCLGMVLLAAALSPARPVSAQEAFTWEGVWNVYLGENVVPIKIVKNADGSYFMDMGDADEANQEDWHPPLVTQRTVTVGQYTMQIVGVASYEGTTFSYTEMNFERTDNPDQLRGSYYARSEHQFSGNDLGWNIVDNLIETDVLAMCAAREGISPPVPCMALGDAFVPPEEEPSEDAEGADSEEAAATLPVTLYCQPYPQPNGTIDISCGAEIYPPEGSGDWVVDWYLDGAYASSQTIDSGSTALFFPDAQPGMHSVVVNVTNTDLTITLTGSGSLSVLVEAALSDQAEPPAGGNDPAQAPESQDSGSDGINPQSSGTGPDASAPQVSPGAQAAAAVGTTGLLAFWTIWEILSWAPPTRSPQNSFLNNLASLFSSSGNSSTQAAPTPPAPPVQPAVSAVKNPPYTGPGVKEIEIFDGADVHTILQGLQLIPPNVKPGETYPINQAQLDALLAGHPDGNPHEITLANGNVVIIDNVQGLAFHGEGSGTEIDFSQGISIAAEVVRPGQVPVPSSTPSGLGSGGPASAGPGFAPTAGNEAPPTTILGETPDSAPPPAGSDGPGEVDNLHVSGGADEGAADVTLLEQEPVNDAELDDFFDGGATGVEDSSAASGGETGMSQEGGIGDQTERFGDQGMAAQEMESSRQETNELVHRVDELLDELSGPPSHEPASGGNDGLLGIEPDQPEAGMIDGEASSVMDDF